MKYTKEQIEQRAREEFGIGFDALNPKEKASWLRSARYRLQQDAIVNAVDNAVENEATTKGWDNAHQGAWELSTFYAEEAGVSPEQFRKYMTKTMRGHFAPRR